VSAFILLAAILSMANSNIQAPDLGEIQRVSDQGPFHPTWASLSALKVPDWYLDGKFGIFIHWGVYSVPAYGSEWYPRQMYQQGSAEFKHHVSTYGSQKLFGYRDFIPQFKAERFDPDAWAALFKEAGAKFVVPVAEHHDGFAMYDCSLSDWCAAKMGPKRDIIGDLAKALRKQKLVLGLSSHRAEHWWFFNGGRAFDSDVADPKNAGLYGPARPENEPPSQEFLDDWLRRTCELVDKYKPQLVWFDWWIEQPAFKPYLQKFAAYYYNSVKGAAINYKNAAFPRKAAVLDLERGQLAGTSPTYWQTDTSISNNSWGYVVPQHYKSAESIVGDLVDIVSKNGALLLNIGPKPDGTIPDEEQQILRDVGKWLRVNGEAIYGTRPFLVFGEGPTKVGGGMFTDTNRAAFTGEDFRFTVKKNTLYAICLAWPGKVAHVRSLADKNLRFGGTVTKVELLGHKEGLRWSNGPGGLTIEVPDEKPCDYAFVFRISGLKNIQFGGPIRADSSGQFILPAALAELHGAKLQIESQGGRQDIGFWDDPSEWVSWQVEEIKNGEYDVELDVAAAAGDSVAVVGIGDEKQTVAIPKTAAWSEFRTIHCEPITVDKSGAATITVHASSAGDWHAINLAEIRLIPRK
jgi:alpha-L-fucosidase